MEPPSDGLKTSTRKRSLAEIFSQGVVVLRISGIGDIGSSAERVMEGAQVFTKKDEIVRSDIDLSSPKNET
mgnify:CR=1 FL=1